MNLIALIKGKLVYKFNLVLLPVIIIGFILSTSLITMSAISSVNKVANFKIRGSASLINKSIESWLLQNDYLIKAVSEQPMVKSVLANESSAEPLNNYFAKIKQLFGFRNIALLNNKGKAIASANSSRLGVDYSTFNYFKKSIQQTTTIIDDPRLSRVDKTPLFTFATQVNSPETSQMGVLFISIPLTDLYENLVNSQQSDPESLAFILTSQCKPLAFPDHKRILSSNAEDSAMFADLCQKNDALVSFIEQEVEYLASVQKIDKAGWYLVSAVEKKALDNISGKLTLIGASIGLIISIIVTIIIIVMFYSISKKLSLADMILNTVSKGDISPKSIDQEQLHQISQRNDELGNIGRSLENLISSMKLQSLSAEKIAEGNLNCEPHISGPEDVLGNAFTKMVNKLKVVLETIHNSSEKVFTATEKMREDSTILSSGAHTQAESVDAVSSSLHEMEMQVSMTTDASIVVRDNAHETVDTASHGQTKMKELSESIEKLNQTGQKISEIMNEITNIASHTNLIALNAAIEAARAGEQGRGFAVVADEVRNLASQTTLAAEKSNALIGETLIQMEIGKTLSEETAATFVSIVKNINQSAEQLDHISEAHQEQNLAASNLHQAITQIETVANDNLKIAEVNFSQIESLSSMSEELIEKAGYFSVNVSKK